MRQVAKKGLLTVVATGGVLAVTGGLAYADSNAQGVAAGSPGVLSGNAIQVPIHVPVNACGNTVNLVGALNWASGNTCVNAGGGHETGHGSEQGWSQGSDHGSHGFGSGHDGSDEHHGRGGASAEAVAAGSPGVASGNVIQVPVDVPVNVCGNSVNVIAVANPAKGNKCVNASGHGHHVELPGHGPKFPHHPEFPHYPHHPHYPGEAHFPGKPYIPAGPVHRAKPVTPQPAKPHGQQLAVTGAEDLGLALVTSAGLLLGGAVLFRRSRRTRA
jgi:hypothetical protein